ncbi:MAG: hypothetical protein EOO06_10710 [Chitinophagaceae bacterium]|nr:MAG: hypothetical protein EOO06_10710 [Chitinophagaceae bacterium]
MSEFINSRRGFLSTLAILTSGTLIAGSPTTLLTSNNHELSVKERWDEFMKKFGATTYFSFIETKLPYKPVATAGHTYEAGQLVSLSNGILVQPTWIYWGTGKQKADDVLVTFYNGTDGSRKLKTINRFELDALVSMAGKKDPAQLLSILCSDDKLKSKDFMASTKIKKGSATQEIRLYNNKELIAAKQLFYNV